MKHTRQSMETVIYDKTIFVTHDGKSSDIKSVIIITKSGKMYQSDGMDYIWNKTFTKLRYTKAYMREVQ